MRSAPPSRAALSSPPARSADGRYSWAIALLCLPVVVGGGLALAGLSWERVVLCTFATGVIVPIMLPWLLHKPFDLFHPLAFVALSVLLGTTARSLYIALVDSETTQWLLDELLLVILLPGVYVLFAAGVCIGVVYWLAGRRRLKIEELPILRREWSLPRLRTIFLVVAPIAAIATADFLRRTGFQLETVADISGKRRVVGTGAARDFASLGDHRWAAHSLVVPLAYMFLILWLQTKDVRVRRFAFLSAGAAMAFPFLVSDRSGLGFVIIGGLIAACQLGSLRYRS